MNRNSIRCNQPRAGIILLVVLSALTFFSILVATYLVFSSDSQRSSFALSQRATRAPDVNWILNESLMTLIRGTSDVNNPFYYEDLLSDYYGHDGLPLQVFDYSALPPADRPAFVGDGFVRFPVVQEIGGRPPVPILDDVYAGSLITFTEGALNNQTYRVLRSKYRAAGYDDLFIDVSQSVFGSLAVPTVPPTPLAQPSVAALDSVFRVNGNGVKLYMNGAPRSSEGIGFSGVNVDETVGSVANYQQPANPNFVIGGSNPAVGFTTLPVSLQPNHLGRIVNKSAPSGDSDEDYDAADHNNWFLSHRRSDGSVIPSFHRPSVLNYILNESSNWLSASPSDYPNVMASFARGTFRPLPLAAGQLFPGSQAINERFTGGNGSYALRRPILLPGSGAGGPARLDQIARALINGPWDVDNDADGVMDSVWVDLGLPVFTSREGKLLRPLVAPMIEDLSGRLNLNAHNNSTLSASVSGLTSSAADWAGTQEAFNAPANSETVFRGLGWGPSEITFPATSSTAPFTPAQTTVVQNAIDALVRERYRFGEQPLQTVEVPGRNERDSLDAIQFGHRPETHTANSGFGYSTDVFGRGGVAMGRSGQLVTAGSGSIVSIDNPMTPTVEPTINEAVNNPYESDPTGVLSGDRAFNFAEFEAIFRTNDFDSDQLPPQLRDRLQALFNANPAYAREFARSVTSISVSDDSPVALSSAVASFRSGYLGFVNLVFEASGGTLTPATIPELVAPELRLGRKIDVNRRFGNLVDDNGNDVIDEPLEVDRADSNSTDDNVDGTVDELGETLAESNAYQMRSTSLGTIPAEFSSRSPNYTFDEVPAAAGEIPVSGRQMLARHLYVLMMALSRDLDSPATNFLFPLDSTVPPGLTPEAYKARRIAQWAVNVIDYRDPDSIMTRFVYDVSPFDADGWMPPADPVVPSIATPTPSPINVVWGVEAPELLLTESSALHDVRLRDTDQDNGVGTTKTDATTPDPHSDQVRAPQGSLILELYCPHATVTAADQQTKPSFPQELFNDDGFLDLGATAPPVGGANGAPVWRIAISEPHSTSPTADPSAMQLTHPDTASFQIESPDELGNFMAAPLDYDRFILFTGARTTDGPIDSAASGFSTDFASSGAIASLISANGISDMLSMENHVFFASNAVNGSETRLLSPGQYLTLAPRATTHLGSRSDGTGNPLYPSRQRLQVLPTGLAMFRNTDPTTNPPLETRTSPIFGAAAHHTSPANLIIGSFLPTGWSTDSFQHGVVGMSVSEPLHSSYYPGLPPSNRYNGTTPADQQNNDGFPGADYPLLDAYLDLNNPASLALDEPQDIAAGILPISGGTEPTLGTLNNYCSAFLQRLADPTRPYNEITNPYRTVDWIPIDLTVFSGESTPSALGSAVATSYAHRSRQKTGNGGNSLFSYATNEAEFVGGGSRLVGSASASQLDFFHLTQPPPLPPLPPAENFFLSSFGFLNTQTFTGLSDPLAVGPELVARGQCNLSFAGFDASIGSLPSSMTLTGNDRNLPQTPFAVHPWLNRPIASPFELMMVPACSQGRLFEEFEFAAPDPSIYPTVGMPPATALAVFRSPFRHLFNFFHSEKTGGGAAEFVKLFDFVHTTPRFAGEVNFINPQRLPAMNASVAEIRTLLQEPFGIEYGSNRIGTVNLNSIAEFPVWVGLMQGHLNPGEFGSMNGFGGASSPPSSQLAFNSFLFNRRGYAPSTKSAKVIDTVPPTPPADVTSPFYNYDPVNLDPRFPTEFAGAYRRSTQASNAIQLRGAVPTSELLRRNPAAGGLLRPVGPLETPTNISMFVRGNTQTPTPATQPHHDRNRNPFMKYQTLMRMPNLVSDNSQAFLLRLTVGFFEVDAATLDLGEEYNASIGQNERYQATFIIDRSIPVGFIPGRDLNSRNVVVFESYAQ